MIQIYSGDGLPDGLPSPDVYFTRGYGRAAVVADRGEWVLLEGFQGAWQVPLIVRTLDDGTSDAISPYGYSGVFASTSLSPEQIRLAWPATISCLRELGVISALLRHSPLVPQAPGHPEQQHIVSGHPTIVLEPTDVGSAWAAMASSCRNQIRKALKHGYTGEVRQVSGDDLAPGGDFRRVYEQTMHRLDAAPLYLFGDDYYRELRDGLGPNLLITEVRDDRGTVVSSMLLLRDHERLHGHLSGSNREDAGMGTNNLLTWTATQFALEQGLRQFHLGGGLGRRDGLFRFKRTFGGRELEYGVSGLIIDQERYQAQVRRCATERGTTPEALLAANFFPAYRRSRVLPDPDRTSSKGPGRAA